MESDLDNLVVANLREIHAELQGIAGRLTEHGHRFDPFAQDDGNDDRREQQIGDEVVELLPEQSGEALRRSFLQAVGAVFLQAGFGFSRAEALLAGGAQAFQHFVAGQLVPGLFDLLLAVNR